MHSTVIGASLLPTTTTRARPFWMLSMPFCRLYRKVAQAPDMAPLLPRLPST